MAKYAIIAGYDNNKVLTRVWFADGKIQTDEPEWRTRLKKMADDGEIAAEWDTEEFLIQMASRYKSGYLIARKIG